jgi:hypothetical protein
MQLLPRLRTFVLSAVLTVAMLGPRLGASTEDSVSHAAGATQNGATLTILAAPVEIARSGLDEFTAPAPSELLQVGDIVRTGPGGLGLITFFDGSESQLGPDSQLQIERLEAMPAIHIALLQTAGVTTNHVVPVRPGGSFQTDTPAAVAMVRGTSYVVAVTGLRSNRSSASPQPATAQVTSAASADVVAQPVEPTPRALPDAPISATAQAEAADASGVVVAADMAETADMASAPDVPDALETGAATDQAVLEDYATPEAPRSPADQVAAAARQSQALGLAAPACRENSEPACLTTVVLLADTNGRVGRVVVEPRASLAAVELTRPGDLGATSTRRVVRAQLSASAVQQLQHRTQNLGDTQAAAATTAAVQVVAQTIELVVAPSRPQDVAPDVQQDVAPDAAKTVAPFAEAPLLTPAQGPSPTPEVMAVSPVVVDSVADAPVPDEPAYSATPDPALSNVEPTAPKEVLPQPLATPGAVNDPAGAVAKPTPADAVPAKPADAAATPTVAPASAGAVVPAAPLAVAPDSPQAPAIEETPTAAAQALATPAPANDPARPAVTPTPVDAVPANPTDTVATRGSVAPATPGSSAPTASGSMPPATPGSSAATASGSVPSAATVTPAPGSEKLPSVGVTPTPAPIVTTLVATPAPSPLASPASTPSTNATPPGSQPVASSTAAPAARAPGTSLGTPTTSAVPPSPAPTAQVP